MPNPKGLEFIEAIEPTLENAKAIQGLTLQDVIKGCFDNPLDLANPSSGNMILAQQQKLRNHPGQYSGYVRNGELVAYIKQNHWLVGDELPFATGIRFVRLIANRVLRLDPSTGQWGIYGFVASDELDVSDRKSALVGLLQYSLANVLKGKYRTVNVVIYENDPLIDIVSKFGFVPVGKLGEAANAPGLLQQRYQRPAPAN